MARLKENISVSLDKETIDKIDRLISFGNRSKYVSEAVVMRMAALKLEKVSIIKSHLQQHPEKIGDIIIWVNALTRMLKEIE